MIKMKVLDLFSGIGGFSLGLERTGGFETVAFCEIEEFPRRVLAKHWPKVPCYNDVRELSADALQRDGIAIDVITGGFPCQDVSAAGAQAGMDAGTRSGLWSEIVRLAVELRPKYILVENVANLLSGPSSRPGGWFGRVLGDLAEIGYDAEWHCISAANIGAPHIRDRVWIVAYPMRVGQFQQETSIKAPHNQERHVEALERGGEAISGPIISGGKILSNPKRVGQPESWWPEGRMRSETNADWEASWPFHDSGWGTEPNVGRVANGVSNGMERITGLGNAVVPQIPEMIGYAILASKSNPNQIPNINERGRE